MAIEVTCGECHKVYELADRLAGQQVRCPNCSGVIQVPEVGTKRPSKTPGSPRERAVASTPAPARVSPASSPLAPPRQTTVQPGDSAIMGSQQDGQLGRYHARHDRDLHLPIWVWFVLAGVILFVGLTTVIWQRFSADSKPTAENNQPNVQAATSEVPPSQPDNMEPEQLPDRPDDPVAIAEFQAKVQKSVVQILVQDDQGKTIAETTGLIFDPRGLIVTTYHNVREGHTAEIELDSGASVTVLGYLAVRPDLDLAILQFKPSGEEQDEKLEMFPGNNLKEGTEVLAVYRGDDKKPVFVQGYVVRTVTTNDLPAPEQAFVRKLPGATNHLWVEYDGKLPPGSGGGPLVGYDGRVLGINSWIAGNKTYALHARHVTEALRKKERFEQVQPMGSQRSPRLRSDTFEPGTP